VPLATALCKNLPAENAQRQLSRPKPTRVVVPTEEEEDPYQLLLQTQFTKKENEHNIPSLIFMIDCCI
jgi:hypothetical protein